MNILWKNLDMLQSRDEDSSAVSVVNRKMFPVRCSREFSSPLCLGIISSSVVLHNDIFFFCFFFRIISFSRLRSKSRIRVMSEQTDSSCLAVVPVIAPEFTFFHYSFCIGTRPIRPWCNMVFILSKIRTECYVETNKPWLPASGPARLSASSSRERRWTFVVGLCTRLHASWEYICEKVRSITLNKV